MASKVFMSDIDGGPMYLDQDRIAGDIFGQPAEEFAGKWAENEARVILGEMESQGIYSFGPAWIADGQVTVALAETLAGFVEG